MKFARITLAMLLAVVMSGAAVAKETSLKEYAKANQSRIAFGVSVDGKKLGWTVQESRLGRHQGRDVVIKTEESFLTMLVGGNPYVIKSFQKAIFGLDGSGQVEYFEKTDVMNNAKPVTTKAVRKGTMLVITSAPDGRTHTRTVPLPKQSLRQEVELAAWLRSPRRAGDSFVTYAISMDERDANKKSVNTFVKRDRALVDGVSTKVAQLRIKSSEGLAIAQMTLNGDVVRIAMGKMVMQRQTEKLAKAATVAVDPGFDIVVKKDIGSPVLVDRMTIEVKGLKRGDFPTSHHQRILSEKNGVLTVELLRDFRDENVLHPLTAEQRGKHLEATTEIQSDDPTIQKLARKIIGKETDPVKQAGLLQEWVFRNLKKTYAISATTSLRVLENKAGKCTDHALLFVALARAVKLPAREVAGVMYVPVPGRPNFGLHAWAEIHDGKRWVTVDPMVCEVFVDGAHFRFSTDESKTPVSTMLGNTSITIVRAETRTALLTAFSSAGVAHILSSKQHLKLLFRAVDKKLLTVEELNKELTRALHLIDMNLRQMSALIKTNLTYADRKAVVAFIEVYRSLKLQAEALKAFAQKRGDSERKAFEQAGATAKKNFMRIGT